MAPIGRQRPRPPPCDPIRRDFRRRQQILNLEEWLKTTSLGDADKQRRAWEVLAGAKAALHDPTPAAWKARPFADKQLYDELAALYAAHRPLRRGESPSLERRRQLHEIQFRGCAPPPTARWQSWDRSVLQGMPPPPRAA
jgi:hypothetical protein